MTVHTVPHQHHLSLKGAVLGMVGAGLAIGGAFGLVSVLDGDGAVSAPGNLGNVVNTEGARDSWEGRIGPTAVPGTEHGVRDSWMPPGTSDKPIELR